MENSGCLYPSLNWILDWSKISIKGMEKVREGVSITLSLFSYVIFQKILF